MPKEALPSFHRTPFMFVNPLGAFAGAGQIVLLENWVAGFTWYFEKIAHAVSAIAGAGAGADQTIVARKGASAAVLSTTTAADPAIGATNIKLTSVTGIVAGQWLSLEGPGIVESRLITNVGTAGGGGTGVDVTPGFANDHANGETARVHANPILGLVRVTLANGAIGAVLGNAAFDTTLERFARFTDTDGLSLVRVAGGTAFTTEPVGTLIVTPRQRAQARA